jgi:hypothetical protein
MGHIIEIEGTGTSVTFLPNDKDKTYEAILAKCKELGTDFTLEEDSQNQDLDIKEERRNIDIQLTQIYMEYYEQREKKQISDAQHLFSLAMGEIKEQFKDQTGAYYATVEKG